MRFQICSIARYGLTQVDGCLLGISKEKVGTSETHKVRVTAVRIELGGSTQHCYRFFWLADVGLNGTKQAVGGGKRRIQRYNPFQVSNRLLMLAGLHVHVRHDPMHLQDIRINPESGFSQFCRAGKRLWPLFGPLMAIVGRVRPGKARVRPREFSGRA